MRRWRERGLRWIAAASRPAATATGRLTVSGLRAGASIVRDDRGVPWIEAADEVDLYVAAGFAQATDRLWQMDVARRRAQGRLSELFGAQTLDEDVRARSFGLSRTARLSLRELSPRSRANLTGFAAGVNAVIRRTWRRPAPEFVLLRYRPEPWSPLDSVAILRQLGLDLSENLRSELFRLRLAREQPAWTGVFGEPRYPADGPVTVRVPAGGTTVGRDRAAGLADVTSIAAPPTWLGSGDAAGSRGSNAWAISGERTADGSALLAGDPHIPFTQPSQWYQVGLRLRGSGRDESGYGVTVPGVPGIMAGANRDLAWAITGAMVDTQDLCLVGEGELPPSWHGSETIVVRGGGPVPVAVAGGDRHVELLPLARRRAFDTGALETGQRYALFWTGLLPSVEIESCQRLWRCADYVELREALRHFSLPVLNVLVAGRDGDIALKTVGRVPRRVHGSGRAPDDLATVAASWAEFLAFDELPEVRNPPEGYLVSANHRLVAEGGPLDLGADWAAPYRAERIEQLITGAPPVTAEMAAGWQSDTVNGRARRVLPTILDALAQAPPADAAAAAGHALLRDWDGRDEGAQAAPLVFVELMQALSERWIAGRLGEALADAMPDRALHVDHLVTSASARAALGEHDPLPAVASRALTSACARLADRLGPEPARWRYDTVHRIVDPHPVAGAVPLFARPATPVGGSGHSVCLMTPGRCGEVVEGAPWRFVAELAPDGPLLRDVLRHGSSGHPLSPHYDDQTAVHARGGHYHVPLDGPGPSAPRLTLRPGRGDRSPAGRRRRRRGRRDGRRRRPPDG